MSFALESNKTAGLAQPLLSLRQNIRAPLKIVIFFVRAKKHRPESRSLRGVNEDSRTELMPLSRKKCIFRGAH